MRPLLGTFVPPLLILLLAVTTPFGTGDGVHQTDLLHPLLPHVHLVNGRIVTHQALETARAQREQPQQSASPSSPKAQPTGPAIGGGAGSDAASAGLGLSPTVPLLPEALFVFPPLTHVVVEQASPTGRVEAPPDPPPTSAA